MLSQLNLEYFVKKRRITISATKIRIFKNKSCLNNLHKRDEKDIKNVTRKNDQHEMFLRATSKDFI